MMELDLYRLLEESGADAFEITDEGTRAHEYYLIRHRLDQHRVRNTRDISVTVYKKLEDGTLGKAGGEIAPTLTEQEAAKEIDRMVKDASYVKNPYFRLHTPSGNAAEQQETSAQDVAAIARDYLQAMRQIPESDTADINSYEIFAEEKTIRYRNSEGVDVRYTVPSSMAEVVINARVEKESAEDTDDRHQPREIELYRMVRAGTCDGPELKKRLEDAMRYGKDRLVASATPALGKIDVVFSSEDAKELYGWFLYRTHAAAIYLKHSDKKIGDEIASYGKGDRVTIKALKHLDNSSGNRPYDAEGGLIRDLTIVEDGIVRACHGNRQYSCYIGLEDAFVLSNVHITGGTKEKEEILSGRFLEAVEFSDFMLDEFSGEFAGEIRLAYLHENGKVTPVTGGSVSGAMPGLAGEMTMSREEVCYNNTKMPRYTRLPQATVSGSGE